MGGKLGFRSFAKELDDVGSDPGEPLNPGGSRRLGMIDKASGFPHCSR